MQKSVNIQNNVDFTAGSIVVFQKNRCQMASEEKGEKDMKLRKFMAVILSVAMMTSMMGVTSLADMVNSNEIAMTDILPSQESDEIRQEEKASPSDAEEEVQENIEDDTNLSSSYISARGTKVSPSDAIYVENDGELRAAVARGGTIIIKNDIKLENKLLIAGDVSVTLEGGRLYIGDKTDLQAMILVMGGADVTLSGIEIDATGMDYVSGKRPDGPIDYVYCAVDVWDGVLTIEDGTVVRSKDEEMPMNTRKRGVSIGEKSNCIMNGGTITGFIDGGITVFGNMTMNGGELSNNGMDGWGGGGLQTAKSSLVYIHGGMIEGNIVGILYSGRLFLDDGTITGNYTGMRANNQDGITGEQYYPEATITGGIISDNYNQAIINTTRSKLKLAGNAYIKGRIINKEGSEIEISENANVCSESERNVKVRAMSLKEEASYIISNDSDARLMITGGTITSNRINEIAVWNGDKGTFEMTGGEINVSGNQSVAFANENKTAGSVKFSGGSMYVTGEGSKALDNKGSMDVNNDLKIEENGKAQFAISVSQTIGGNVTVSAQTAEIGTQIAVNVTPDSGYKISDVKVDGVSQGAVASCTFIVIHNHNVEVVFVPKTSSGGGSSSGSGKSAASMQNTISETPGNWTQDAMGWKLLNPSGTAYVNTWARKSSQWYWIGEDSYMKTGWNLISEKWYYLTPVSGEMKTGWIQLAEKWYYLDTDGKMAVNTTTSDGYKVDDQGARIQ